MPNTVANFFQLYLKYDFLPQVKDSAAFLFR